MRYFITSSKDATIYSGSYESINTGSYFNTEINNITDQNTGIDQILEVINFKTDKNNLELISRALIEFDYTGSGQLTNPTYSLQMYATELRELKKEFNLEVCRITSSWDMGLGKRQDNPITTDGVSWNWRDASGSLSWNGGNIDTGTTSSFEYKQKIVDLNADITDIVSSSNGYIIKFTDSAEASSLDYGAVNFFSSETHTIYKPKLVVEYNDSDNSNRTGSISTISADNSFITITNLRKEYTVDETYKFELFGREEYPSLTLTTGSVYSVNNYLPTASEYSIVDNVTEDVIVPFGVNSKISSNSTGSYFRQNFKGFEAERYYRILIKLNDGNNISIVDKNFVFKLVE